MTKFPKFGDGGWEPYQDSLSLNAIQYQRQLSALAQLFVSNVQQALYWLSLSDPQKIALIERWTPQAPPSVYIPYLDFIATQLVTPIMPIETLADLNLYFVQDMIQDFDYRTPFSPSTDNAQAVLDQIHRAEDDGKPGLIVMPAGQFKCGPIALESSFLQVIGMGRSRVTWLFWEPEDAGDNVWCEVNSSSPTQTTIVQNRLAGFTLSGYDLDYMSPTQRNNRHKKTFIRSTCSSELKIDIDMRFCWTGNSMYGAEGGSVGVEYLGKEYLRWLEAKFVGDIMLRINPNPKEPGTQIDCDEALIDVMYASGGYDNPEYLIQIGTEGNVNFLRSTIGVRGVSTGGEGFLSWIENTSGYNTSDITIKNVAHEQALNSSGDGTIRILKNAPTRLNNLKLNNIVCDETAGGLNLNGLINAEINNGGYFRYTNQTTSPKAIKLGDFISRLTQKKFFVPDVTGQPNAGSLLDLGTTVEDFSTSDEAPGYQQLPTMSTYTTP